MAAVLGFGTHIRPHRSGSLVRHRRGRGTLGVLAGFGQGPQGLIRHPHRWDQQGCRRTRKDRAFSQRSRSAAVAAVSAAACNRLSRLVKGSKRYLVDSSLVGSALRLDERAVLRDGDLLGLHALELMLPMARISAIATGTSCHPRGEHCVPNSDLSASRNEAERFVHCQFAPNLRPRQDSNLRRTV